MRSSAGPPSKRSTQKKPDMAMYILKARRQSSSTQSTSEHSPASSSINDSINVPDIITIDCDQQSTTECWINDEQQQHNVDLPSSSALQLPQTSFHCSEQQGAVMVDAGESILDCLPTSYDEFETTELHMRLERNVSTPLTSPTPIVFTKSASPPIEIEDMEVAMINESFEEQQKQTQLYDSADLKSLFYSRPNATQSSTAIKSTRSTNNSGSSSSIRDHSPPTAVTSAAQQQRPTGWAGWGAKKTSAKSSTATTSTDESSTNRVDDQQSKVDTVECWEDLCDSTNELDPKIIQEINWSFGNVHVDEPKFDYTTFNAKCAQWNDYDLPHVLEVYGYPTNSNVDYIRDALIELDCGQHFDIKPVDGSHALVVFPSVDAACKPLVNAHSRVKLRPLTIASAQSQQKARQCADVLKPYRPRPQTNAALARRLVESALGKRSAVTTEQRNSERQQLVHARDRKIHREAIWEGNV